MSSPPQAFPKELEEWVASVNVRLATLSEQLDQLAGTVAPALASISERLDEISRDARRRHALAPLEGG